MRDRRHAFSLPGEAPGNTFSTKERTMKQIYLLIKTILSNRRLVMNLAKNDFRARYSASFLGAVWAFVQPLITILVFWFVFQMGFKSAPVDNIPYILWFIPGIYFSDILTSCAGCMQEYGYLVKKVRFHIEILPAVKILSAGFVHIFFVMFIFVMYAVYRIPFSVFYLQAVYYTFALTVFGFSLGMLVSAIAVLFKDFVPLVGVVLQIGFWAIPIFWNPETMEPWVLSVLKLNPTYYIVSGYRDCFIAHVPFWERPMLSLYFWVFTLVLFLVGCIVFSRLRPHFADEL